MPNCYILIGLPGSGKSTWRSVYLEGQTNDGIKQTVVISQDDLVDEFAEKNGMTYSEAFKVADLKSFEKIVKERFAQAVADRHDIILDRTNMSKKSRAVFLSQLPKDYRKIAVLFNVEEDELKRRLAERAEKTGKFIPDFVIENMKKSYESPDFSEFDSIITKM